MRGRSAWAQNSSSMAQESASRVDFFSRCGSRWGWRRRSSANTESDAAVGGGGVVGADQLDRPLEPDAGVAVGEHLAHPLDVLLAVAAVAAVEPLGLGEPVAGSHMRSVAGAIPQASASWPMVSDECSRRLARSWTLCS